jgi:penicillin G amidase
MKRALVFLAFALLPLAAAAQDFPSGRFTKIAGMDMPGMITRESNGIPHIFAFTRHDLFFLNGWVHAQDRLFQMDFNRRAAAGTLAEVLGQAALSQDVQLRTLGLRRAAAAALPLLSADSRAVLDAYAAGVNAYASTHALPPEYGLLGLNTFVPWSATDSVSVGKLIAFQLSFDSGDTDQTVAYLSYQGLCKALGCDAQKLFFVDTYHVAPFTPAATIPDATTAGNPEPLIATPRVDLSFVKPETLDLLRQHVDELKSMPMLAASLDAESHAASNEWAIAGKNSTTGNPLLANDPHLSLGFPPNFYPISMRGAGTNVAGMGFPGAPWVIQGQNAHLAWGSTVFPADVTDYYQEQLVPDAASPSGFSSLYKGAKEQVVPIPETYRVNVNGTLQTVTTGVPAATLVVPRHGPIVSLDTKSGVAISVQYAGFYPTHELEAFNLIDEAKNVDEFKAALQFFDIGEQNFAVATTTGDIAYFTSGELPIREDLAAGTVNGAPPFFIRNGQGGNEWLPVKNAQPNQALPFEILPYAEMPQVVNPSNGWFVSANNDPLGLTLDNDPLNTPRANNNGILYLGPAYDGVRAGRITQLIRQKLANGGKISPDDMKAIQADTVLTDAEVFVPYIKQAFANAQAAGANGLLRTIGSDPAVAQAMAQLSKWDYSTPTGIANGYDASDVNGTLAPPSQTEIDNSIAATIYAMWRSRFLANTMDAVLSAAKMPLAPAQQQLAALRFQLDHFALTNGVGLSGLPVFNLPANAPAADPAAKRDIIILKSLADGLALLQSDAFADVFNHSASLDDYRWGKLHRIVFSHVIGSFLSPGAAFGQLPLPSVPPLSGLSTDGGLWTVDVANHNARATKSSDFLFDHGPNRRYVGDLASSGPNGQSSLPGGVSGIPGNPLSTNLLMLWLTNDTFPVTMDTTPRIPFLR